MGLFDTLKNAIFGHASAPPAVTPPTTPPTAPARQAPPAGVTPGAGTAPVGTPPPQPVDIEAVLDQLNAKNQQKLNWRSSIVDLMKLVGMDSGLQHRKDLAKELGYTGDSNDSAAMNIWLHAEVMKKLAQSGGKIPASLQR